MRVLHNDMPLQTFLHTVVAHYDPQNDFVSFHEALNELNRIQAMVTDAYERLRHREQEKKPQSTPVGVGSGRIGKKVETGRDADKRR